MLLFYIFCFYIRRYSKSDLVMGLNMLMKSIHKNISNYKLLCFNNFTNELNKQIDNKYNIEYRTIL